MVTETQKRIEAYRELLPGLREKVTAVAFLLALSVIMLTSASYAWLTISRAPEVTAVSTNIAANGSLEIALATGNGLLPPGESQVGDSAAAENQTIVNANTTWGNLINLNDEAYGLENLVLRPAQLNRSDLLGSPLYGALYTADGRIDRLSSEFAYTSWIIPEPPRSPYFGLSSNVGVRAISSTKVSAEGTWVIINRLKGEAESANALAGDKYLELTKNKGYMESLSYIMGVFMTDRMNPGAGDNYNNQSIDTTHLGNLVEMYRAFEEIFELEADAIVKMLNLQLFLINGDTKPYTEFTVESLMNETQATLTNKGLKITDFNTFKKDYNLIKSDRALLEEISNAGNAKWRGPDPDNTLKQKDSIKEVIASLVNLDTCTVNGDLISSIGATKALELNNKTNIPAVITNGVIYNFEQRVGVYMDVGKEYNNGKGLKIVAKGTRYGMSMDGTIYAYIKTSAEPPSIFSSDLAASIEVAGEFQGEIVAQDTYGMAVDFWVRTNASNSYLVLEGNILTTSEEVIATGEDADGNVVEIYTITRNEEITNEETGESETIVTTVDLYKKDVSGTEKWYYATSHREFTLKDGETPTKKMETITTVIGFEGENRVWDDSMLSVNATTQGGGSCYVYYADTPEDQAKSLKLLNAFKVAFVGADGKLMAEAEMATDKYFAESGRVTVPLVLSSSASTKIGTDDNGNDVYGITLLEKNVATRITAVIYLDGAKLTNEEVLAAADIQGQLNIQFGSSGMMLPIDNEELAKKERIVSADIDNTSFDYDTYQGEMKSTVTVTVTGEQPKKVTAFFLRQVNKTQGSREGVMEFTKNANGDWVADYTFTAPGTYVLRSVKLDGVDYDLASPPQVVITGFKVENITCSEADANRNIKVFSTENSYATNFTIKFAADSEEKLPKEVQGRFLKDDGTTVNINFTFNPTTHIWSGSGTFVASGEYTMQYVVLDGKHVELAPGMRFTADVTLGIKVAVYTTSPTSFKYDRGEMQPNEELLGMQVRIMDNAGEEMPSMSDIRLYYKMEGAARTMDTDLEWNSGSGYYEGNLMTLGEGRWTFDRIEMGSNTITSATTSPVFTIFSSNMPKLYDNPYSTGPYQFAPDGKATMNIILENANGADVKAVVVNKRTNQEYTVTGSIEESYEENGEIIYTQFLFNLPADAVQDGIWQMKKVLVTNCIGDDGSYIPAGSDRPYEIDLEDENYTTKVVETVRVSVPQGQNIVLGAEDSDTDGTISENEITASFMQGQTFTGLKIHVLDFEDKPVNIPNIPTTVTMHFVYNHDSESYGGYTINDAGNITDDDFTATFTWNVEENCYISGDISRPYAGTYTADSVKVSIGTKDYSFSGDNKPTSMPTVAIYSIKPTVEIDYTDPKPSDREYNTMNKDAKNTNVTTSIVGRTITIFPEIKVTGSGCDTKTTLTRHAKVGLRLNGLGNGSSATLNFAASGNDPVYMYSVTLDNDKGAQTSSYEWTSDATVVTRIIGNYASVGCSGMGDLKNAGTLISDNYIIIKYSEGGITLTFTVSTEPITIIQDMQN